MRRLDMENCNTMLAEKLQIIQNHLQSNRWDKETTPASRSQIIEQDRTLKKIER